VVAAGVRLLPPGAGDQDEFMELIKNGVIVK
jgi:hypothetical protein